MDQEQVLDRGARVTLQTGKHLLQFLYYSLTQLAKKHQEMKFSGEMAYKDFMKSPRTKDHREFVKADVDFKKLQKAFKDYGVDFSLTDNKDGTMQVWFYASDEKVIAAAVNDVVENIVTNPKEAKENYMKPKKSFPPKEQIKQVKEQIKAKLQQFQKPKQKKPVQVEPRAMKSKVEPGTTKTKGKRL